MWFSQPDASGPSSSDPIALIPGEPTVNDAAFRTYNVDVSSGSTDYTRYNPWRAPGSAPVIGSGCGRAGGGPIREYNGGTALEFGLHQNMDGADLPPVKGPATVWTRGAVEEVAWAINANHGGGYAYRLCKNSASNNITEECFQRGHLHFEGDTQWLSWTQKWAGNHTTVKRVEIPRVTVSNGTHPAGSPWARVPIPACRFTGAHFGWPNCPGDCAGCCASAPLPAHPRINESWWRSQDCVAMCAGNGLPGSCPAGETQFPEPLPGLSSLWSSWLWCDAPHNSTDLRDQPHDMPCSRASMMATNIVDHVRVPDDLEPGQYLLSWRWDVEQTHQIWQNCADVTIR